MKKHSLSFHHYALISIIFWATSYVATKLIVGSFSSGPLALIRCFVASVVLAAALAALKIPNPKLSKIHLFIPSGLIGLSLYNIFFNQGSTLADPSTVCVLIATAPILTAVMASFLFKETLNILGWLAIAFAFAGILVMTFWEMSGEINAGVLWTALAAFVLAIYNLLQRNLARTFQPLQITAWSFYTGTFFLLLFLPQTVTQIQNAPAPHTSLALYLGVFPSAVAYLAWVKALSLSPKTSYVTNYMFLTPVLAAFCEVLVIAKYPDLPTVIGGGIIMSALFLFYLAGKRENKTTTTATYSDRL